LFEKYGFEGRKGKIKLMFEEEVRDVSLQYVEGLALRICLGAVH
jgi:hypothetical protein